jgi:uracil-DNA glycosylase
MSWKEIIKEETSKSYFKQLSSFLIEDGKSYTIYPKHSNVFNAFKYCPLDKIKVCLLGQDPYHQPNQAHGLSFSVPSGETIPPSLRNIFKEIQNDLQLGFLKEISSNLQSNYSFDNGCLIPWAQQGVLLLNTVLTVRDSQPGSHRNKGWETFTDTIIDQINQLDRPVVFLLWGSFAKSKKILLNNSKHLILEAAHPSPLSAYNGFFGCQHFSKANRFLIRNTLTPIDWRI